VAEVYKYGVVWVPCNVIYLVLYLLLVFSWYI